MGMDPTKAKNFNDRRVKGRGGCMWKIKEVLWPWEWTTVNEG